MRISLVIFICTCALFNPMHAEMKKFFLQHPTDAACRIEVLCDTPDSEESYPLLLFLHGASVSKGADFASEHFQFWKDKGIAVAAISMPGFGGSNGTKDYCGSFTMQALHSGLDFIKEEQNITSIGIIGFGIGGLAGTLLASQRTDLSCVVSINGGYDLSRLNNSDDVFRNILIHKGYIIDYTEEEISKRSPQDLISSIKTPLFIFHRELTVMIPKSEVLKFAEALNASGGNCTVRILNGGYENPGPNISHAEVVAEAQNWILWHL